jgi:hypothetical protein
MKAIASRLLPALLIALAATLGACRARRGGSHSDAAASAQPSAAPRIVADDAIYNFGKVKQGASVEHVYKVRNQGARELVIDQAKGS